MTLGNRIQQLRKDRNLSQGDLADALGISRQSVSKWETDTATPDLDKLLKLSELFQISLDELIKGTSENNPNNETEQSSNKMYPYEVQTKILPRQIVGTILCCMAFLAILFCTIQNMFLSGLILSIPFVVCGLICFLIKKHTGLYCAWTIAILTDLFMRFASGAHWTIIFHPTLYLADKFSTQLIVGWTQFLLLVLLILVSIYQFRNFTIVFTKQKEKILLLGWILFLLLHVPLPQYIVLRLYTDYIIFFILYSILTSIIRAIIFTALIIVTHSWYKQHKTKSTIK